MGLEGGIQGGRAGLQNLRCPSVMDIRGREKGNAAVAMLSIVLPIMNGGLPRT
jgi:hypothetical protein